MNKKSIYMILILLILFLITCGKEEFGDVDDYEPIISSDNNNIPIPPTQIYSFNKDNYTIKLKWEVDAPDNVSGYKIYRQKIYSTDFTLLNNLPQKNNFYFDSNNLSDTIYYYSISSISLSNVESQKSDSIFVRPTLYERIISIDGIKDDNWNNATIDSDPIDAPWGTPEELTDLYISDDTVNIYIGFTYYKFIWDKSPDVHFGIGIDYINNSGYTGNNSSYVWGHSKILFDNDTAPDIIIYFSNNKDTVSTGEIYYNYNLNSDTFNSNYIFKNNSYIETEQIFLNDFCAALHTSDTGWLELKINKNKYNLNNIDNFNFVLWVSQDGEVGASDVIPGSKWGKIKHSDEIIIKETLKYNSKL